MTTTIEVLENLRAALVCRRDEMLEKETEFGHKVASMRAAIDEVDIALAMAKKEADKAAGRIVDYAAVGFDPPAKEHA